jgi:hypothetical protein
MAEVTTGSVRTTSYAWIRQDSTGDRRSRAAAINAAKREYERANGVTLTLIHKSYSETHGFLARSEFRYTVTPR